MTRTLGLAAFLGKGWFWSLDGYYRVAASRVGAPKQQSEPVFGEQVQ